MFIKFYIVSDDIWVGKKGDDGDNVMIIVVDALEYNAEYHQEEGDIIQRNGYVLPTINKGNTRWKRWFPYYH